EERAEELAPLDAELARLARVVDGEAGRQARPRLVLEERERLVERDAGRDDALDAHRVELLEALQLARLRGRRQLRERRERHELAVRTGDVEVRELVGRQALGP